LDERVEKRKRGNIETERISRSMKKRREKKIGKYKLSRSMRKHSEKEKKDIKRKEEDLRRGWRGGSRSRGSPGR